MSVSVLKVNRSVQAISSTVFHTPEIIGYFTLASGHNYSRSLLGLKYVIIPKCFEVKWDLNHGIERAVKNDENEYKPKIYFISKWFIDEQAARGQRLQVDFVCSRGILKRLMCTPYSEKHWIIYAIQMHGTIILFFKETEEDKIKREQKTEKEIMFCSWGYKFEQYMTTNTPNSWPSIAEPVNEADEFIVMFKSKLNEHTLAYGAEIDGIESKKEVLELEGINIIELKTNRHITSENQAKNFRRLKTLEWWSQSFLTGTKKIICGYRNNQGIVENLKHFKLAEILEMGKEYWDENVCVNFCDKFLTLVKNLVQQEDSALVCWKFERKSNEDITVERFESVTELGFSQEWYIAYS